MVDKWCHFHSFPYPYVDVDSRESHLKPIQSEKTTFWAHQCGWYGGPIFSSSSAKFLKKYILLLCSFQIENKYWVPGRQSAFILNLEILYVVEDTWDLSKQILFIVNDSGVIYWVFTLNSLLILNESILSGSKIPCLVINFVLYV